ncbi:PREDICTED: dynamin-binding protein-like [Dufourea novaeangliae]|uniref:Dynamin-binding protein n=1 Tax=Dufourea novaeangliae TaxID=178035 RepID=A0A154NYG9_DUFNO|nr:PREDICTED: dynamin-binding protein-like [Dufourea novaeangliae]KZC04124.1 Dynamin-binding protein [Dufourea novaeangliae]
MEPGILTKVLSDFFTTVNGELSLQKGEYFLVYSVVDKHWCYGESRGRSGKFPSSHLHKVDIPRLQDSESLYVTTAAFPGQQDGDLCFGQGELIIGKQDVGSGWYFGQIDAQKGIFPLTHVWQLDSKLLKKASETKTTRKRARIKTNLKAQLDGELDLVEGEMVIVTEILDDGWCRGITDSGKEGIFPEGFVSYINDSPDQSDETSVVDNNSFPTRVTHNDTAYKNMNEAAMQSYIEEPAPDYYDLFPQYKTTVSDPMESIEDNISFNTLDVKPYAITLYPFNAQFPNELSFGAKEVVHLIKHIDSEWMEGTIDNHKGIFPISYVNIIVDCIEISNEQNFFDQDTATTEYNELDPDTQARVEYTFKAQMDGDLSVKEGDTVTVINMANADWVNVKNASGKIGLCPRGYLSVSNTKSLDDSQNILEDFVVIQQDEVAPKRVDEQKLKRLSEPHRPAPPVPAPGSVPLQKDVVENEEPSLENANQQMDIAANNNLDVKQKRADQRQNVISELVITEKEYVRDLKLTYETFNLYNPNSLESLGVDVTILFGNIFDVIQVAEELLDMILKAMKGCDEELQTVGPCFTKMAEKLKIVYVKYCGNHEAALILLKKYETNEEIMTVFNKGIETLRYQVACFDMSSILIKPVQRILKYPLILYELVKCTDDNHPDKSAVEEAWKTMTAVASHINEYKRRKDLVSKYLDNDNTLMSKMAKLNMHSVAKMSTRLSTRLSASLGLTNVAVDQDFEQLERQFRSVEKCTFQLAKDVEQCLIHLSDEAISGEVLSDFLIQYYQGTPNIDAKRLRDIRSTIWSQFIQELKVCLKNRVSAPVNYLATLLEGPAVLITKRHDKLLDYDAAISKGDKYKESRIVQDELTTAKSNYEALTQQLLEELPILNDAATKVLVNCIDAFAQSRKLLCGKITKRYLTLCETLIQLSPQDILETFLVNHSLLWNQITRFTFAGTNPRIEGTESKWCPQSERQRIALRTKYQSDKLYIVTENVVSTSSLDMAATCGTLVAVIKKQDPMGDTSRWFVDNGVAQGFLSAKMLQLQQVPQVCLSTENNTTTTKSNNTSMPDLICMDSPIKEQKSLSQTHLQELLDCNIEERVKKDGHYYGNVEQIPTVKLYQNLNYKLYYAEYDFAETIPRTLPIIKGQALRLVRPHDEKGNDEWWLMEDGYGNKGYVPKNYLHIAPTTKQ